MTSLITLLIKLSFFILQVPHVIFSFCRQHRRRDNVFHLGTTDSSSEISGHIYVDRLHNIVATNQVWYKPVQTNLD